MCSQTRGSAGSQIAAYKQHAASAYEHSLPIIGGHLEDDRLRGRQRLASATIGTGKSSRRQSENRPEKAAAVVGGACYPIAGPFAAYNRPLERRWPAGKRMAGQDWVWIAVNYFCEALYSPYYLLLESIL